MVGATFEGMFYMHGICLDMLTPMFLAHANCTLFFTSRAAFVCKKKTRSFRVFPPEN